MTTSFKNRRWVGAGVALALTLGLAGCTDGSEADAICVRASDHVRVDDSQCGDNGTNTFILWYLLAGQTAPRYGYPTTVGSSTRPAKAKVYRSRVSPTGGTVPAKAAPPKKTTTWQQPPKANGGGYKPAPAKPAAPRPAAPKPPTKMR